MGLQGGLPFPHPQGSRELVKAGISTLGKEIGNKLGLKLMRITSGEAGHLTLPWRQSACLWNFLGLASILWILGGRWAVCWKPMQGKRAYGLGVWPKRRGLGC